MTRKLALITLGLLGSASAGADIIALDASHDNTLFDDGSNSSSNGAGAYMYSGQTGFAGARRALLTFDVASAIPAGSTINSVTLRLHVSQTPPNSSSEDFRLHTVDRAWGEGASDAGDPGGFGAPAEPGDATWVHTFYDSELWATPGGDFDPTHSASTNVGRDGYYDWSSPGLAGDVQNWVDGIESNYGWIIIGREGGTRSARRFDSRENTDPAVRPSLTIDYTPVPEPTGALIALPAIAILRRRR